MKPYNKSLLEIRLDYPANLEREVIQIAGSLAYDTGTRLRRKPHRSFATDPKGNRQCSLLTFLDPQPVHEYQRDALLEPLVRAFDTPYFSEVWICFADIFNVPPGTIFSVNEDNFWMVSH